MRAGAGSGLEVEKACFSEVDPQVPNTPSPHVPHAQGDGCPEQRGALVCVPTGLCQENCCSHLPYRAFLEGRALFSFWVSYSDLSLADLPWSDSQVTVETGPVRSVITSLLQLNRDPGLDRDQPCPWGQAHHQSRERRKDRECPPRRGSRIAVSCGYRRCPSEGHHHPNSTAPGGQARAAPQPTGRAPSIPPGCAAPSSQIRPSGLPMSALFLRKAKHSGVTQ